MSVDTYQSTSEARSNSDELPPRGEYPNENIIATAGGIEVRYNDQPGKESFTLIGPSGSSITMMPDGRVIHYVVGEHKVYNKGGVTITVDENNDVHIKGHNKIQVGGGSHVEVQGDAGILVGGDIAVGAIGNMGIQASGNMYLGARGNLNVNVEGDMTLSAQGDSVVETGGTMKIGSGSGTTVQGTTVALNPAGGSSGYVGGTTEV